MRGIDVAGYRIWSMDAVGSTNDLAHTLARKGEPHGLLIRAQRQSDARGRHNRHWSSPKGNLYCSIILRPDRPLGQCASLSLLIALALHQGLAAIAPELKIALKWPNDLLIGRKKVAGILLEAASLPDGAIDYVICGTGVNVTAHPSDLDRPVTDLAAEGAMLDPKTVMLAYLDHLGPLYERWLDGGFDAIRRSWTRHASGIGRNVKVKQGQRELNGLFAGLDEWGNLRLMTRHGEEQAVLAGELEIEPR